MHKLVLVFLQFTSSSLSSEIPCTLNDINKTPGVCINIKKCPYSIGNLEVGIDPTPCGTHKDPYNVCCPTSPRISQQKCEEYKKIYRESKQPSLTVRRKRKLILQSQPKTTTPTSTTTLSPKNGIRKEENEIVCPIFTSVRISGGRNASMNEYPYQVELGYPDSIKNISWRCGGVLISPNWILTAGHCARTTYGAPVSILLGDRILSKKENPARQIVGVEKVIVHPLYKPPIFYNDIALIELNTNVTLSRSIFPACLPQPQYRLDRKKQVQVTGFGQLGALENTADILQSAELNKFDTQQCSEYFLNDTSNLARLPNGIISSQFCAGDKQGIRDTCPGDSGGGSVVNIDVPCIFYVVGITSFGSKFCGFGNPGVYTVVQHFMDWIESVVWPKEKEVKIPETATPHTTTTLKATTANPPTTTLSSRLFLMDTPKPSEKNDAVTPTKPSTLTSPVLPHSLNVATTTTSKPSVTTTPTIFRNTHSTISTHEQSTTIPTRKIMLNKKVRPLSWPWLDQVTTTFNTSTAMTELVQSSVDGNVDKILSIINNSNNNNRKPNR